MRLLSFMLLLVFFSCQQKFDLVSDTILETKLDSVFSATPDFSGVILVAREGTPIYHKALGFRNFETREPLDTTSIFELASVSKQFTAMTIMMLQEEGKLQVRRRHRKIHSRPALPRHHHPAPAQPYVRTARLPGGDGPALGQDQSCWQRR